MLEKIAEVRAPLAGYKQQSPAIRSTLHFVIINQHAVDCARCDATASSPLLSASGCGSHRPKVRHEYRWCREAPAQCRLHIRNQPRNTRRLFPACHFVDGSIKEDFVYAWDPITPPMSFSGS